jgi:hypothetical protein
VQLAFGERLSATAADGRELRAAVFDENQVRAAAGLTLVLGAVAFAYAFLDQQYVPLQVVTCVFFVEFLTRVTVGIRYSPLGVVAHAMTRNRPPEWVSAKPKRFAWTLGLVLSFSMVLITNGGIRGVLPGTICMLCMTRMWMESARGVCLGCEIHGRLVRRGWTTKDPAYEVCAGGACELPRPGAAR